ncbi:Fic family protein [Rodentibacter rarus]|nr:Fic family protein [Rodentibacter rarus]
MSKFENCNTTLLQTEHILNYRPDASVSLNDVETILNLRNGLRFVLNHIQDKLTFDFIKKINFLVAQNDSLDPGEIRHGQVGVSLYNGERYVPPIPKEEDVIQKIAAILENNQYSETYRGLVFMLEMMKDQVFWDGNKRTAMLAANTYFIQQGLGIIEISENYFDEFNLMLAAFYQDQSKREILLQFLYENCIQGIDY